jgi:hypothetical protein
MRFAIGLSLTPMISALGHNWDAGVADLSLLSDGKRTWSSSGATASGPYGFLNVRCT